MRNDRSSDRRIRGGKRSSRSGDRRIRGGKRSRRSDERRIRGGELSGRSDDRRIRGGERSGRSGGRHIRGGGRSGRCDDRSSARTRGDSRQLGLQLVQLLPDLVQHTGQVRPVEAHLGAAPADLQGSIQGRKVGRNPVQQPRLGHLAPLGPFLPLDGGPVGQHVRGAVHRHRAEHVGVAPHQLGHHHGLHRVQVPGAPRLGQLGVEDHLQPQIAQLLAQVALGLRIPRHVRGQGLQHLSGLLAQVAGQALVVLLQVPGASGFGLQQGGHHGAEGGGSHASSLGDATKLSAEMGGICCPPGGRGGAASR